MSEWIKDAPTIPGWYWNRFKMSDRWMRPIISDKNSIFQIRQIKPRDNREWWPERIQEPVDKDAKEELLSTHRTAQNEI